MNIMNTTTFRTAALALLALAAAARAETYEDICRAINEVASRQLTLQTETRGREEQLARALAKGTHDTPEMKATRAQIEKLKTALVEAEQTLRRQFEALPALQPEIRQSRESLTEIRKLDAQRQELIRRRDAFVKQHTAKPTE
jgi:predicted  nucleic acid-binding Zn-ribbon protein